MLTRAHLCSSHAMPVDDSARSILLFLCPLAQGCSSSLRSLYFLKPLFALFIYKKCLLGNLCGSLFFFFNLSNPNNAILSLTIPENLNQYLEHICYCTVVIVCVVVSPARLFRNRTLSFSCLSSQCMTLNLAHSRCVLHIGMK